MEEVKIFATPWGVDETVRIIRIEGFLDTTTSQHLAKRLDELLEREVYRIVIDLESVDYISSPGWGILVGDIRRIRENGGDLKLARMKPEVYEIYTLLGLDSFIESYDSVEQACTRFAELPLVIEQPIETPPATEEITAQTREERRQKVRPVDVVKQVKPKEPIAARPQEEPEAPPGKRWLSLTDMINEILEENPTYNTWQVKRELDTERYDFTKASWFKVYRELRRLRSRGVLAEERKLTIERQRLEEMRKDFSVERRLWEVERRLKLQKDELEMERRKLQSEREEFERERERLFEEMHRKESELKESVKVEMARQAALMNEILNIVKEHPEYGPKRLSDVLESDHFISRSPSSIYAKLKRAELNTKEKRLKFAKGAGSDAKI